MLYAFDSNDLASNYPMVMKFLPQRCWPVGNVL